MSHQRGALWLTATGLLILSVALTYFAAMDGRWKLLATASAGLVACAAMYQSAGRLTPRYYAPRLLILGSALQLVALAAVAALGLPLSPPYHPFDVNATDGPERVVLAMTMVPLGALLAAALWRAFHRLQTISHCRNQATDIARERRPYLIVAAVILLLFWPAAIDDSGVLGYAVRILSAALMVSPFLAGRDGCHDRGLAVLWCFTLVLNAGIGIAGGARSKAFVAVVIFVAGWISAMPKRRRSVATACALVATVPLILLSGAIGVVRNDLGRGGLELLQADHIKEVFRQVPREMTTGDSASRDEVKAEGVSRMLAWTNVVVPLMTPEAIPYRGLDGLADEAALTFQIASLSGRTADDLYDAGLFSAPARLYGFTVNSSTSVEFTLAADGWSRGGAPMVLLFSFLAGMALVAAEASAYRLQTYGVGVATILALPVAKAAFFTANILPFLPIVRTLAMELVAVAGFVVIVELARAALRPLTSGWLPRPAGSSTRMRQGSV